METPKFEQMPLLVADLNEKADRILSLLNSGLQPTEKESEIPLKIKDVAGLTSLSVPTIYGYCQKNEIPHHKKGNRLYFFKSEIIDWIKTGRRKTMSELMIDAENYVQNKKK